MAETEERIAELYGLPLAQFTRARDDLARERRAAGSADEAERIRALRKPSLVAWALNMLPRLRANELDALLRAGEAAERTQRRVLAGEAGPKQLQRAVETLRQRARRLAGEAGEILVKDGHAAREQTLARVAAALEGAATADGGRRALRSGTFTEEPAPAGFDVLAGVPIPARRAHRRSPEPAPGKPAPLPDDRAAARLVAVELRDELRRARKARRDLEATARRLERDATAAERAAQAARAEADAGAARAEEARRQEADLAGRLAEAEARLKRR